MRVTRRILSFHLPFKWENSIKAHFKEFADIQNSHGYILKSRQGSELFESFFERFGERLLEIGEITSREMVEIKRALCLPQSSVPNLEGEHAKAMYLDVCLQIGQEKFRNNYSHNRWWDNLLPILETEHRSDEAITDPYQKIIQGVTLKYTSSIEAE